MSLKRVGYWFIGLLGLVINVAYVLLHDQLRPSGLADFLSKYGIIGVSLFGLLILVFAGVGYLLLRYDSLVTEYKRAEGEFRESQSLLRLIFAHSSDGINIAEFDPETTKRRLVLCNERYVHMSGYSREELMAADDLNQLVHYPDYPLKAQEHYDAILQGVPFSGVASWLRPDGMANYYEWTAASVRVGDKIYVVGVDRDITERKRVEEALREERDRAQKYLDVAGVIVAVIDADEQISLMNKRGYEVLGYSEREIIGQKWFDLLVPKRLREEVRGVFRQLMAGEVEPVEYYENPLLTKNGEERIIAFHNTVLTDEDGSICAAVCSGEDITERKQAEEALQQAYERNETILATSMDGFYVLEPDGSLTDCNKAYCEIIGYSRDELLAMNIADLEAAETPEETAQHIETVMQTGSDRFETAHRRKDGRVVDVEISATFVQLPEESFFVCFVRDVTERKQVEDALHESEAFSASLVSHSSYPTMAINPDASIRYVNPALEELTGFSAAELVGTKAPYPFWAEETLEQTGRDFPAVMQHGAQRLEQLFQTKAGQRFWVEITSMPIEREGQLDYYFANWVDITERKRAEEALQESEQRLRTIFETAEDSIFIKDRALRYTHVNPAMAKLFDRPASAIIGTTDWELFGEEAGKHIEEVDLRVLEGETVEEEHTKPVEDMPHTFHMIKVPMRGSSGEIVGVFGIARDITERKRTEADLAQSAKMMSLAAMAAGIAHEVRNPLAIISSCTLLLQEHSDDEEIRNQCIEKIGAACQRASLVIESLLKFTQPQEDQVQKVNLNAVLEEAIALLAHDMEQQGITLRTDFQPDLPNVMGSPALLRQVFINLMLNADAAMPQGGRLTLTTRTTAAGEVAIEFADTGRGVMPEHLPKIFDPFFTTMPPGEGTGLGLAISYSIIQQHKGTIEVDSQPGQGSTFIVRLPGAAE